MPFADKNISGFFFLKNIHNLKYKCPRRTVIKECVVIRLGSPNLICRIFF